MIRTSLLILLLALPAQAQTGWASYYGRELQGHRTASGERFDYQALTAASRSLPFGTRLKVTNLKTRRSVVVRINDRGPFARHRILDLSEAAARRIGLTGVGKVHIERLN